MKKDITELYCFIEDFCRIADEKFSERLISSSKKPTRIPEITTSEI
ncbi:IS982 family transposase, partial [Klebsiella pneumoniae subsp. pneumoniae]|nr:IS982 family transposase [Klebsiella pneumoniae subsp. pneumoniae]